MAEEIKEVKDEKKVDLFREIFPSLDKKTSHLIDEGILTPEEYGKHRYIVNLKYSMGVDTILIANELNLRASINNKAHYDFCYYAVPYKKYRFDTWAKRPKQEDVEALMTFYNLSETKAKSALKLISDEDMKAIKKIVTATT